jgi:hypothetical protein
MRRAIVIAVMLATHTICGLAIAQDAELSYRIGVGMGERYLSLFSDTLRVTLLLQECQFNDLAAELAKQFPNSVKYFHANIGQMLSEIDRPYGAQVTRAYVLGYEIGVRTEFQREQSDEIKKRTCSLAAAAAGQLMDR